MTGGSNSPTTGVFKCSPRPVAIPIGSTSVKIHYLLESVCHRRTSPLTAVQMLSKSLFPFDRQHEHSRSCLDIPHSTSHANSPDQKSRRAASSPRGSALATAIRRRSQLGEQLVLLHPRSCVSVLAGHFHTTWRVVDSDFSYPCFICVHPWQLLPVSTIRHSRFNISAAHVSNSPCHSGARMQSLSS